MAHFISRLLIAIAFTGSWVATGQAYDIESSECYFLGDTLDVGYSFGPARQRILVEDLSLEKTQTLSDEEIIQKIRNSIVTHNRNADPNLAQDIFKAARSFGIDPFIFTSLVKYESTFKIDSVSDEGARGLTQLTGWAFAEMRNQLDLGDDPKFKSRIRDELVAMIETYFGNPQETQKFLEFIAASANRKNTLEVLQNTDYALVTGAMYLKLMLAINGGDYRKGLEAYNGESTKARYAQRILNSTNDKLQPVALVCHGLEYSNSVLAESCQMSGDSRLCQDSLGLISL